ncbi:MAG TPA: hypothetical protein VMZ28_04445 [Kofleriaceae bacterium]|nr:hypothetical protein [Kofleriaceae bacterium]
MGRRGAWALVFALGACSGFREVVDAGADGGEDLGDAGVADLAGADLAGADFAGADLGPPAACRVLPLDCLDPTPANVIEVPGESTASAAFAGAKAGDTIQLRAFSLGAGFQVPAFVTLRGCEGSVLKGGLAFAGSGGVVEGFEISGTVVANKTGSYVVRFNRFVDGGVASEAGVSARSIDALVSASVTALVDSNRFTARAMGVEARTQYDTMTHEVTLTVRNNIFDGVASPVTVSESGLVGKITPRVEHNTFHGFDRAIRLFSVDNTVTVTAGNLFSSGTHAVDSASAYEVQYSFVWQVTTPAPMAPLTGTFAVADPAFADPALGDFRLGPGSLVIDTIPAGTAVPAEDFFGCPRPRAFLPGGGGAAKADPGAVEAQP